MSQGTLTFPIKNCWASQVAQWVKKLPAMQETQESREVSLEEGMATHSSVLAWKIPWTEEPGRLQSKGSQSRTWLSTNPGS